MLHAKTLPTLAIFIASDIILSLLPLTFIHKIHRPLREKVLLAFLMGLGLFTSAAATTKLIVLFRNNAINRDPTYEAVKPLIWANLEQNIGLIAACIPPLRFLLDKALTKLGWQGSKSRREDLSRRGTAVNTRTQRAPILNSQQSRIIYEGEDMQSLTHRGRSVGPYPANDEHTALEHELARHGVGMAGDTTISPSTEIW
jgi:hypothetical protein